MFILFVSISLISVSSLPLSFADAPDAVTGLGKSQISSATEIYLKWNIPASDSSITGYKIESAVETSFNNFNAYTTVAANTDNTAVTYTVTGLSEGDFLKFRVSAISSEGTGSTSNEFMTGTAHGAEDHSGELQNFSGEQNFGANSKFASSQNFTGSGNHNFGGSGMEFGTNSTFTADESFGNGAEFDSGIQNFAGANKFGANSTFAVGQTFAVAQTFNGSNTFGAAMHFGDDQNFGGNTVTSGDLRLDGLTTGTTDWFTIIALIDEGNNGVDGLTNITATNAGAYDAGIIYADFSAVTFGSVINDVTFTDGNNNGVIDCTGTADNACELADLPSPVTFAAGTTIFFEQDPPQIFGANTVFSANTTFVPGQTFSSTQNFADGAMNFKAGMNFFAGQDFNQAGVNHDFNFKGMQYGSGSDFATAETFGDAGNFTSGVQLFSGANKFGKDTQFATSQSFSAVQSFSGANTFGAGTTFNAVQNFAGISEDSVDFTLGAVGSAEADFYDIFAAFTNNGSLIEEIESLEHDTTQGIHNSLVQVDADTYALAYEGSGHDGWISTFTISADGSTITEVASLEHDTTQGKYNSLVQVDDDTYALAYSGVDDDGFISTFTINSAGVITAVKTQSLGNNLEHDTESNTYNSLVQVDADTYALAYTGVGSDGFISTFTINSAGVITAVKTQSLGNNLEHDTADGIHNSLVQVDDDTYALAYAGVGNDGFISTFTINSAGVITAVKTQSEENNLEHDTARGNYNSLVQVDADTYALAYTGVGNDGFISTFTINSAGVITPIRIQNHEAYESASVYLEHETADNKYNSLVQVDDDTYALAYTGNGGDGFISTFTINSAGVITAVKTQSEGNNLEHDTERAEHHSLVQVDDDTYALAYATVGNDGFISTFTIDVTSTSISATNSGSYSSGIIYADFSAVTFGNSINDVQFTDANSNGIIDCVSDGACELADLSTGVTFANTATITFTQDSTQTFGSNTAFTIGTSFGNEQAFTSTMDFTDGALIFAPGMEFFAGQDFTGFDHNFAFDDMTYGLGSTFKTAQNFGMDANFTSGIMTFLGANTFGKDSIFAASQTFAVAQTFNGSNTFGAAMHFGDNQNFGGNTDTSGDLRLDELTTGTTDWFTIIALIDEGNNGVDGITAINATNAGGAYSTGIIYADFSAVTFGSVINDVTFTDGNNNGVIDCTGTADNACELADLPSQVTFAAGTTISFEQDPHQSFGANTVFSAGTTFVPGQTFDSTQNFADGAMNFKVGMEFFAGQDFTGVNHDFNFKGMKYGSGSDFATAETFGEAGNFTSGVQLFNGANTFGKDSMFAALQTFAVAQTFNGSNTFGSGTTFATSQDFSTAGIVTSASTAVATDVLINDQSKQDAAFPSISASSGSFETGLVTITFSDVDNAKEDKIQEVFFTDADLDGVIDDGELGRITDVTTSSDTIIITQAKTQDFDAGAQSFGANMKFAENQKFSEHVQTFGTGIEFSGNANFTAAQTFAADITFDDGQDLSGLTDSAALSATGMTFGSVESIDFGTTAKTFGASATFAENQNFTSSVNHDLSASDLTFKNGTLFLADASEVFGEHVNFDGVIDFPDDQVYSNGAEFADNQSWDVDQDPVFANFTTFGNATSFAEALDFKDAPNFAGNTTFVGANTFGAGTEFETGVTFTEAQTFSGAVDFGVGNLTAAVQTIQDGSQFELGSTFANDQVLPLGTVLSAGLLLSTATCSGAANDCLPTDDADILSKGEIIVAGTTIPAIKNTVTKDNPTLSIDGLGISMTFASITTDGNLDVTVKDPNDIVTDTGATLGTDGALQMSLSGDDVVTSISSIIDFDLTGSTANSGVMTITLPYQEANIPAGTAETDLTMLHYEDGEWITEDSCTVDTTNNQITCTVTSLSPFGVGGSVSSSSSSSSSSGGGGGNFCDSNGFGTGRSLMVYNVNYSIDTNLVTLQAYSTCGTIIAKITTESGSQVMGLSMEQPLIDEIIVVYSATLHEDVEDFTINVHNKKNTFDEKYYPHGNDITKSYTGEMGYTPAQQGISETPITDTPIIIPSEPVESAIEITPEIIEEINDIKTEKPIIDEKSITPIEQTIGYTPEPTEVQTIEEGGGCLIATATYGSEMASEVQQLRELRDNTLLSTELGTNFMSIFNGVYYSFSPSIADYERENPLFKEAVKIAITPMISTLSILNYVDMNSESEVLGYGISLIILNLGMYLGVPAIVIIGIRKRF